MQEQKIDNINWKYEIGQRIIDYNDDGSVKRDLTITNRKIIPRYNNDGSLKQNIKCYKYYCNQCTFDGKKHYSRKDKQYKNELWITEYHLLDKRGCSCCAGKVIVENINSIYHTDKWMIPYIGEEIAKTHTYSSHDKIKISCPDCGKIKYRTIRDIYRLHSIACSCSDNISYPEKIMLNLLEQLNVIFTYQFSKTNFNWCDNYKYDFYFELNNEKYICEVNGLQHYDKGFDACGGQTIEEVQVNDKLKRELALANGIKEENYIVIDCRKSDLDWIRDNDDGILNSRLAELFDLSKINWLKIEEFALSNLVKEVCCLWNDYSNWSIIDICRYSNLSRSCITKYLNKGYNLGWCTYNGREEMKKSNTDNAITNAKKYSKPIKVLDLKNNLLYMFFNSHEAENYSNQLFGITFKRSSISSVCNGRQKIHKGYIFKHTTKEEYNQWIKEQDKLHNQRLGQAV